MNGQIYWKCLAFGALAAWSVSGAAATQSNNEYKYSWSKDAKKACENRDFQQFFEAFVNAPPKQKLYISPKLSVSKNGKSKQVKANAYSGLPIAVIDNQWVTRATANDVVAHPNGTTKPWEYLDLEFNTASDGRVRIDWVRMGYKDGSPSDEGDNSTGPYGQPGYVIFSPVKGCWQLVQDTQGGDARGPKK